jgi:predicted porin
MKKSLLAVAAIGAFASAAQAQSSVTVYGILDVGFNSLHTRTTTGATTPTNATSAGFSGNGNESTSRIGFKGTEDLGGGTSAFFTVEVAVTPNSAQNLSTGSTANRQTLVGLKKNGIGAASIGTQYTPVHLSVGATDPGAQNNVVGNVIYPNAGTPNRDGQTTAQADGGTFGYVVRSNNALYLKGDNFAGFTPSAFYTQNNSNTNDTTVAAPNSGYTGGNTNASGWGLGLDYAWKKLFISGAYQSFKAENPYSVNAAGTTFTAGAPVAWGVAGASAAGTNTKDVNGYVAATYDFGILKAYAQYLNRKVTSVVNSNNYLSRSAQQIGVRSYITPTIEGWASVGNGRVQAYGNGQPTANFVGWQLGSNYYLSKRTNLYAIYGMTGTSNVSQVAGQNPGSSNASQYAVGVRHTF